MSKHGSPRLEEEPDDENLVIDLPEEGENEEKEDGEVTQSQEDCETKVGGQEDCEETESQEDCEGTKSQEEIEESTLPKESPGDDGSFQNSPQNDYADEESQDTGYEYEAQQEMEETTEKTQDHANEALTLAAKIRRRRKTFTSFKDDGSYVSSICESVKMRQRRKSVYLEPNEDDDKEMNDEQVEQMPVEEPAIPKKKPRRRKSIGLLKKCLDGNPGKIKRRRRTMYASDFMDEDPEALAEFPEELQMLYLKAQETSSNGSEDKEDDGNMQYNDDTPSPSSVQPAGSSRRKSSLKPMTTDVRFEKMVSYRNPNIPFQAKYKTCLSMVNKFHNPNFQLMRRLACLKVFRQYIYKEVTRSAKLSKALKKALNS